MRGRGESSFPMTLADADLVIVTGILEMKLQSIRHWLLSGDTCLQ